MSNTYLCACHARPATKPSVVESAAKNVTKGNSNKQGTLGTWHCPVTNKKCKVSRQKKQEQEVAA